jgi:mono/diheme cytochrome c family protein
MFSQKCLSNAVLAAAITIAGASAFITAPAEAGADCKTTAFKFAEVKKACADKGTTGAKKLMKDIEKAEEKALVAAGKEKSGAKQCSACHTDKKDYGLKDNAVADYEAWRKLGGHTSPKL